jgi:hypothetical protein
MAATKLNRAEQLAQSELLMGFLTFPQFDPIRGLHVHSPNSYRVAESSPIGSCSNLAGGLQLPME